MTTIQIEKQTLELLKKAKEYPRQTYNDLILKMVEDHQRMREHNQYDEFLHKIQQAKMKELWENDEDDAWDTV
ncbi:MAG TPA: hypothetical protein VKK79_14260 [Candidatus Lokiarchaeia archaeon]|nr:hypothetical protein [Candidatus Lokiarchaeia archaeon]